ncbi:hypothetical protein MNEG_10926 [Monoraphidium neglectum]|uniref:Uncharacterized protein n=1 Tax=Monoraphidium neglectum TaxID=145388 RepID=A0A0D2MR04_9CHLO|nr:hypothetical protein MNEG_10926 [Monoraphidium neglectum]KIY97035.1 hypothetical protein MNEG_10926 [Monoraphidium neglectum]|eukprot:XP_013896055.1 hypothetical protein MNEG_10926 [Monoraphidium neglectum]
MSSAAVKVPEDLLGVNRSVLEDYVRSRQEQLLAELARRLRALAPGVDLDLLSRATAEALAGLPQPDYGVVPVESLELQLVFAHDCSAPGCAEPQCVLCQHSTARRCGSAFDSKYLVGDTLAARCGAGVRVELVDPATGAGFEGDLPEVSLEVVVLDGNAFSARYQGESARGALAQATNADFDAISLLHNNRGTPLLVGTAGNAAADAQGRVLLRPVRGRAVLPDVQHAQERGEVQRSAAAERPRHACAPARPPTRSLCLSPFRPATPSISS